MALAYNTHKAWHVARYYCTNYLGYEIEVNLKSLTNGWPFETHSGILYPDKTWRTMFGRGMISCSEAKHRLAKLTEGNHLEIFVKEALDSGLPGEGPADGSTPAGPGQDRDNPGKRVV